MKKKILFLSKRWLRNWAEGINLQIFQLCFGIKFANQIMYGISEIPAGLNPFQ